MAKRPKAPQWVSVTSVVAEEALYRYPEAYQESIRERMFTQLLIETTRKNFKWVGWPEFEKETNHDFGGQRWELGVWAVPA